MLIEARKLHAQVNYGINQNHPTSINVDTILLTLGQIGRIIGLVLIFQSVSINEFKLNANCMKQNTYKSLEP